MSITFTLASIICVVLVPCCGYFGAKKSDKNLTCCFCGCNCLAGCGNIFFMAVLLLAWKGLRWMVDNCEPGHSSQDQCSRIEWETMCPGLDPGYTAQECWRFMQDTAVPDVKTAFFLFLVFCIPSVTCQCLSFVWGKELYDVLKEGQVIHSAPNYVPTVGVPVQPVQQVRTMQPVQAVQAVQAVPAVQAVQAQPVTSLQNAQALHQGQP